MSDVVEIRCPNGPQRLFGKFRLRQESARIIQPDNLIEFSCSDCSRARSRVDGPVRVFHRYDFAGNHVETLTHPKAQ